MFGTAGVLVLLGVLAAIVSTVFSIWLVVIAFRKHVLWGLASLFLPFAAIVFAVKYWQESRKPFLYGIGTGIAATVLFVAAAVVGAGAASKHLAEGLGEDLAQEMAKMQAEMEAASQTQPTEPSAPAPAPAPSPEPVPVPASLPVDALKTAGNFVVDGFSYDPLKVTKDGYVPVSIRDAASAVGRFAKVVSKDGQSHRGHLVRADSTGLELERSLGGGTVSYRVAAGQIDAILVDVKN